MTQIAEDQEFQSRMGELNGLLEKVQRIADPHAREITSRILQTMMEFHGAGLHKILGHIGDAGELGHSIVRDLAHDDLVSSLLLLYGLHPQDLLTRVKDALDKVRPVLAGHGGNVELLEISDQGAVRLRLQGSCHGCGSSTITLKNTIEQAIYNKAPDVTAIHVDGVEEPATRAADGFVSVEQLIATTTQHSLRGTNHVR